MFNSNDRQPYEFIFRNSVYILMDKVKDEIMFAQDFFLFADMSQLTNEIFGKTIAIYNVKKNWREKIENSRKIWMGGWPIVLMQFKCC